MIAVAFFLAWGGYGLLTYGHALVKGYNLSFGQVFSPTSYYKGPWPPPMAANTVIFPDGKTDNNLQTAPSSANSVAAIQAQAAATAKAQGRPLPGSVQSRL